MSEKIKLTPSQWVESLAKEELPAITSIASMLDKFSNDDVSSIPKLSKVILHDQALSSRLLKVANNSQRVSVKKITTVSRAAIVLGIQSIKNICLTSKILEGLLKNKDLVPDVYDRLMMLMANAFYAGLLARMMVPNLEDDTQEEIYLAAMLYHIGETSFWSTGSVLTEQLIKKANLPPQEFESYCASLTGVRFTELSVGLAKTWNLGELLVKSLDRPESRTDEVNIISLANQLSAGIANPPKSKAQFEQILARIAQIMKINKRQLESKIEATRELALKLLNSYGAEVLENYIKPLPKPSAFIEQTEKPVEPIQSQEQALLAALKTLTSLTKSTTNISEFLAYTLQVSAQIIGFERCTFWVLSRDKSKVESRTSYDNNGEVVRFDSSIQLDDNLNIIKLVIQKDNALLINDYRHVKWRNYVPLEIEKLIDNGVICLSPVKIGEKSIGVISAQSFNQSQEISQQNFSQFSFLIEHLNMCLTMISHR
ncbi:MAG: HD-like signal output (HDOD) protein [Paraglaciecola sp.]|jgi:HD-like signal output (HDOD) protein